MMLEKALQRMAVDLEAAPDIGEWRTVQLEIAAKPIMEEGELAVIIDDLFVFGECTIIEGFLGTIVENAVHVE